VYFRFLTGQDFAPLDTVNSMVQEAWVLFFQGRLNNTMAVMKSLLPFLAFAVLLPAQPPTPTAVFDASSSQSNTTPSCLVMQATVQAPGMATSPFPGAIGIFSPSRTFAFTCDGTLSGVAPGVLTYVGQIEGGGQMPFLLAVDLVTPGIPCGGSSGSSCLTGGSLFGTTPTPFGLYHRGATPLILLDGIAGLAPPASLNFFGRFLLAGSFAVDTVANGGGEVRLGLQALVADPGSMSGFTLTACLNVDQWVEN